MNHTDIVSLMAATLYAGLSEKAKPTKAKPTSEPDQLFYDRIANQAWDLYNAVVDQRGSARYSSAR